MNVLIAADYSTPASGNFIASCVELGRTLKGNGDNLTFIFPENQNTLSGHSWVHWLEREGFQVYLTQKNKPDKQILAFLKEIIERHDIEILHIHFGLFHHTVINHTGALGVKILIHDHMDFAAGSNLTKQKAHCLARSMLYRKNAIAIASVNPQKNNAYLFARHWYIPNGLSLIRNVTKSATREECRRELGIAPDEKVCMFLGWDVHRKGLDIAVKAISEIRKDDPNMLLGVVGLGDPPKQERLQFIADSTSIDPNSSWIKYFPSREDMFAYHRAVDVYLSASRSEAFSYGILEAISQNTPVAVSDIKGTSWCYRYEKAVAYPTEDAKACARAVRQALALGRAPSNADEIVKDYAIEKWCEQMINIYKAL